MSEYKLRKEQFGNYLPGMAPHQDDLDAMGYEYVYRGLHNIPKENLQLKKDVGIHWSYDENVAKHFATSGGISLYGEEFEPKDGYVVSGRVHPQHIADVEGRLDDLHDYAYNYIFGPESNEQEATVRRKSPVRITGVSRVSMTDPGDYPEYAEFEETPVKKKKPKVGRA